LPTNKQRTDRVQTENSSITEATLILCGSSGERANKIKPFQIIRYYFALAQFKLIYQGLNIFFPNVASQNLCNSIVQAESIYLAHPRHMMILNGRVKNKFQFIKEISSTYMIYFQKFGLQNALKMHYKQKMRYFSYRLFCYFP